MNIKEIDFENDTIAWICHFDSDMRNNYIIEGFYNTANLIYDNVKKSPNGIYQDDLVYPFLHIIRHTIELQLKLIIFNMYDFYNKYKADIITFDLKKYNYIKKRHNIKELYNFIKNNYFQLDDRCNEYKTTIDDIYHLIVDFIPEGDNDPYRYAEDVKGNENLSNINLVSFDNFIESLNTFKNYTESILFQIEKLNKEYELGTYYKRLSRQQIKEISLLLPNYLEWKNDCFTECKKQICKKYDISNNDFSKVIKIIQNSRWLSFYINYNRKNYDEEYALLCNMILLNLEYNSNKNNDLLDGDFNENLSCLQKKYKKILDKIKKIKLKDIVLTFAYYRMGHEILQPENFDMVIKDIETSQFSNSLEEGNTIYFIQKLTNINFIFYIMHGIYSSGDYELFFKVLVFLHKNSDFNCEELDAMQKSIQDNISKKAIKYE